MQTDQYLFQDCEVNLLGGGTKKLARGIYPVVVANGQVQIDIIRETRITLEEFMRLQGAGLAKKQP